MTALPTLLLLVTGATAWPLAWTDLEARSGSCDHDPLSLEDPAGDVVDIVQPLDLVGDGCDGKAAAAWGSDETTFFLRLRLDSSLLDEGDEQLVSGSWGFLLDTDGDLASYEAMLALDGDSQTLELWANSDPTGGWDEAAEDLLADWADAVQDDQVRLLTADSVTNDDLDAFIDLAISYADLSDHLGVQELTPISLAAATGSSATGQLDRDLAGCDAGTETCSLESHASVAFEPIIDGDEDGLTLSLETSLGTDPADADTDDDGLFDGEEYDLGTDPLVCDTDNDGIIDGIEVGVTERRSDTQIGVCWRPDNDPTTSTDPLVADTDGDGLIDGTEDADASGSVDEWESDPNDPDDADNDGDGIADGVEAWCDGSDSTDQDGDGIEDATEGATDSDSDGDPDFCDTDADNDGLPDIDESTDDTDGDGTPDYLDKDSDDDGLFDGVEGTADPDCDGLPAFQDYWDEDGPCADIDQDGWANGKEALCGTDPTDPDSYPSGLDDCFTTPGTDHGGPEHEPTYHQGHFGGGCSSSGGRLALAALLPGLLLVLFRRRRAASAASIIGLGLVVTPARAQDLDAQRFHPAPDQGSFIQLEDAWATPQGLGGTLSFNYAQNPLVYHYDDSDRPPEQVLASVSTLDLLPFWRIGPARVGLDVPLHLQASGDGLSGYHWIGDLALDGKWLLLDRKEQPLGVALHVRGTLPTGNEDSWLGSGVPTVAGDVDLAWGDHLVLVANLGAGTGNGTILDDLELGPTLRWGLGMNAPLTDPLYLLLEVNGAHLLPSLDKQGAHPIEALLGIRSRSVGHWVGSLGMGAGISHGLGAPGLRLVTSLAWVPRDPDAPPSLFVDGDRDGLVDERDACPDQPEDFDGRTDRDGCPDSGLTPLRVHLLDAQGQPLPGGSLALLSGHRTRDHWRFDDGLLTRSLPAGPQRLVVSAPGHHDLRFDIDLAEAQATAITCSPPVLAALARSHQPGGGDTGGDVDGDGLGAAHDACPDQPEDENEQGDGDGCPDGYLTTTHFELKDTADNTLPSGRVLLVSGPMVGAWSAPDGRLERGLVPGDYLMAALAEGYRSLEQPLQVPEQAEPWSVVLSLEPDAPLSQLLLSVQDSQGQPIPARAWAQGPLELLRDTDNQGELELSLPAGRYRLHVSSPGFLSHRGPIDLRADGQHPLIVMLQPVASAEPNGEEPSDRPLGAHLVPLAGTTVAPEEEPALRQLADLLRAHPEASLVALEGWVPPLGERGDAWLASYTMAENVRDWLVDNEGIAAERLLPIGQGAVPAEAQGKAATQRVVARLSVLVEQPGGAMPVE